MEYAEGDDYRPFAAGAGPAGPGPGPSSSGPPNAGDAPPWRLLPNYSRTHAKRELSRGPFAGELEAEISWEAWEAGDGKRRVKESALADALGVGVEEARRLTGSLCTLLPSLEAKVTVMRLDRLVQLVTNLDRVGRRVVQLRGLFPGADLGRLVSR